jgi:hypothetical protein
MEPVQIKGKIVVLRCSEETARALHIAWKVWPDRILIVEKTQRVYVISDRPMTAEEWQAEFCGGEPIKETH